MLQKSPSSSEHSDTESTSKRELFITFLLTVTVTTVGQSSWLHVEKLPGSWVPYGEVNDCSPGIVSTWTARTVA